MTGSIITAVTSLVIAVLATWSWPSLERRAKEHVALLKDLPEGVGKEFREAVERELDELARQTRIKIRRKSNRAYRRTAYVRPAIMLGIAASGALVASVLSANSK